MTGFAPLPDPPYYAVIFATQRTDNDHGYGEMADAMEKLASEQPGHIGMDTVHDADGRGITVSYWADKDALKNWKAVGEHMLAQKLGRTRWYEYYSLRVAKVERHYEGPQGR
jgi:heme-degrading monooxygenase HmoA